ncbi:MAG: nucleoside deaminase [Acetilactobacillus jinshanensis]
MNKMDHKVYKYMRMALQQADYSALINEVPIGAVIVRDHKVIGTGHNLREMSQDALGHAELYAIQEACDNLHSWRLEDCDMYVTIEPCIMCAGAIVNARMRHLYYGAPDPKFGGVDSLYQIPTDQRLNHQVKPLIRCGDSSGSAVRNDWTIFLK